MIGSKLFFVLKSLDKKEVKRFRSFSLSPYHNTNKTITRLIEYIEKHFHILKGKSPTKKFKNELIYKAIYNDENYNEGTFSVLRSQTFSLLEEFFISEGLRRETKLRQKVLTESYKSRNLPRAYKNNFLKFEEMNLADKKTDPHWTVYRLGILMEKMGWHEYDKKIEGFNTLLEVLEDLDIFYLHHKMRYEVLKANISRIKRIPIDKLFLEKKIGDRLTNYSTTSNIIDLYQRLHQLLSDESTDLIKIEKFRKDFDAASKELEALDNDIIYIDLQNLLIREYNKKGSQVSELLFDTFLTGIRNNIIDVREEIKFTTFYNVVNVGCYAKKFDRVEIFVKKYGNKINEKDRISTLILTKICKLFYERKKENWEKIIDLSNSYNHSNLEFRCNYRSFRVRAFFMMYVYDESYFKVTKSQIKAFKVFLMREKTSLRKKGEQNQRLSYWLQKILVAINEKRREKDILKIFDKIEADTKLTIVIKEWILKVRDELKNR